MKKDGFAVYLLLSIIYKYSNNNFFLKSFIIVKIQAFLVFY